jgi:hypothetical protein
MSERENHDEGTAEANGVSPRSSCMGLLCCLATQFESKLRRFHKGAQRLPQIAIGREVPDIPPRGLEEAAH